MFATTTAPRMSSRRPRRAAALALGVVTALALAGCSSSSGSSGAAGGGTTTLSFTSWDTQAVMQPLVDEFQKENADIKIDFSFVTPANYIATLQTRLLAGTASDVFIINPEDKLDLVKNKEVADLSGLPFASTLSKANVSTYSVDNKLYGLSVASWGGGIMYNKDLLAKAGYSTPPTSWADFLALCKKLKAAGVTPFLEPGDGITVSLLALLGLQNEASGGTMDQKIFSGQSTFEKEWTPALETWGSLFTSGAETRAAAGLTGDQVTQEFINGGVAMIGTGSWNLSTVTKGAPDMKVGFFAVPGTKGNSTYWAGAASPAYAINAKTPNSAQAQKFLTFLAGKSAVELYNKGTGSITTTSTYSPAVEAPLESMVKPVQEGKIYFASVSWPKYSSVLSPFVNSQLQQFIQGKLSAQDLAKSIDAKLAAAK